MTSRRYYAILLLLFLFISSGLSRENELQQLMEQAEENPQSVLAGKQAAIALDLPVQIFVPNSLIIEVYGIEGNQPLYGVIRNFAHPAQGGSIGKFADIRNLYDAGNARITYGNDRVENAHIGQVKLRPLSEVASDSMLMIPESTGDRVMLFDMATGEVIDLDFVPSDTNLTTPIQAVLMPTGDLSVSDQAGEDQVQQFDTSGTYLKVLAPAGGQNTAILDNMRGHAYHPSSENLLVTVASNANAHAIAEFDLNGDYKGNFITNGAGGLSSPWGIIIRSDNVLVTGGSSDAVHQYDLNGNYLSDFATGINFPEQLSEISGGNIAVANFSNPSGVSIFDASGNLLNTVNAVTGLRGVWELGNGNLLVTNGAGVHEVDPTTNSVVRQTVAGASARFISLYAPGGDEGPVTEKAAYLNAGQEVPAGDSPGTGSARMTLNGAGTELSYEIHVRDLVGNVNAMHFHNAPAGANGGVVKTIVTGVSAGDTTIAGVWTSGDTEPLTSALVDELLAGNIYINVHTDSVPSGEIRGQVVDPEVPKKLLISEFVVTPTGGEFVEIYNPGPMPVDLTNYYLTDATFQGGPTFYYQIVLGAGEGGGGGFGDWHARFPEGASIAPGEFQTVALNGDSLFADLYGVDPTYELHEDGTDNPNDVANMREARPGLIDDGGGSLLTGGDEVLILYYWDGLSDLVADVDYVIYDDTSPANNEQVDKTGVVIDGPDVDTDGSAYLPDTDIGSQVPALGSNNAGFSSQRIDFTEGAQTTSGGNGVTGADETSEDLNNTFVADLTPTPNSDYSDPGVVFTDDFESGVSKWTLTGSWALTEQFANSPTHSLTESPGGNYAPNLNITATMANGVDLSASFGAELSFYARYNIEQGFDYMYIEASADGSNWVNLDTFDGEGFDTWELYTYSLSGFVGNADVKVRFRFFSDGGYEVDGMYIDDVMITSADTDTEGPLIVHEGPAFFEGASGDFVRQADIIDISGVGSTNVHYAVDGGSYNSAASDSSNDDTYYYTVPGQETGANVAYTFDASDGLGNSSAAADTFEYVAGTHLFYDNAQVDFVTNITTGNGVAVRVSVPQGYMADLGAILLRTYTDVNRPFDSIEVHVWAEDNGLPGSDLITPFNVWPEATLANTRPMTRVDLRDHAASLADLTGDFFIGFITAPGPVGETWIPYHTVGNERAYTFSGGLWQPDAANQYHFRAVVSLDSIALGIEDSELVPTEYVLEQNYPNPFNPTTTLKYGLKETADVTIRIYNVLGQMVKTLVNAKQTAGFKEVTWDGTNDFGVKVASGIYIYRLNANDFVSMKKMILLK